MKYIFTLLLLFGCASNEDKVFVDQVSPDLVETFKIENKKFAKFVVEKNSIKEEVTSKVGKTEEKVASKITPTKIATISKKKAAPKLPIETKKEDADILEEKKQLSVFPDGYPSELIKIDVEAAKAWKGYTPLYRIGEELVFSISYLGITAGHVRFITQGGINVAGKEALHFRALFKTSHFYKYIYEADDMVETYVSADRFLPIKYSLVQRESNKDVDDLQLFDQEAKKTYLFFKRIKKKNNQISKIEKEAFITEYYQDFMSTLFFVRGLPLKNRDVYKFPVFTRGKFWRLEVKVVNASDRVKVMGGWRNAIKVETIAYPPLNDKSKSASTITFWYSKDSERIFLKLKAKLKFGSIEGEIEEHLPGRLP